MQSSSVNGAQNAPANEPFPGGASLIHGRATERSSAKARPANDPAAVASWTARNRARRTTRR